MQTAWELFVHELRDALNFENKLVHVLGEQARETDREDLRDAFTGHRKQTEKQAERLIDIFREIGETPEQADCKGIDGLTEEKLELMKHDPSQELLNYINVGAGIKFEGDGRVQRAVTDKETLEKLERFSTELVPTSVGVKESPEGGLPRKAA